MKELSIEQKAKAYDEAIERASNLYKDAVEMDNNMTIKTCKIIFPELKESIDEKIINDIEESLIAYKILVMDNDMELANYIEKEIVWLKFLKEKIFKQLKQEWNEKDNPYYDDICEMLINLLHNETANVNKDAVQKDLDWFNSLKDRYTFKPNDKQILELCRVISGCSYDIEPLVELKEQLKKLKG